MAEYVKQPRRKYCQFCKDDAQYIDYKDTQMLRKYVTDRGKIKPRRVTGACTQHQRDIANAVKRAREMALMPPQPLGEGGTMKVILLKELKGKGGEGDVIDVAPGFANNYLLTQGYAVLATKGNLKQLEQRKHNIAKREEKRIADAEALKAQLEGIKVKVDVQVGEEGQLFGSVTTHMIADAIKEATGTEIDKRRIELNRPIKVAGIHDVSIALYREIKVVVKLQVGDVVEKTAETAEAAEDAE
mgnify:CR=1 FL=1